MKLPSALIRTFRTIGYWLNFGSLKYGRGSDYDALRFWEDRFTRYKSPFRSAGDRALSDDENRQLYDAASKSLMSYLRDQGVEFTDNRILEVGNGPGYYTNLIAQVSQPASFTGVDISAMHFRSLRAKFPHFEFIQADITEDRLGLGGEFDIILMIDVVEHIVTEERFTSAMTNIKNWLAPGGVVVIAPVAFRAKRELFYLRWWHMDAFTQAFRGYLFKLPGPYRDMQVIAISSPEA